MKEIIELMDMHGRKYLLKDFQRFYKHIQEFHSSGTSIHEEHGYYFRVDDAFREKINGLLIPDV